MASDPVLTANSNDAEKQLNDICDILFSDSSESDASSDQYQHQSEDLWTEIPFDKPKSTVLFSQVEVSHTAKHVATEKQAWNLFFSSAMAESVVCSTNKAIAKFVPPNSTIEDHSNFGETTSEELLAYFGLLYMRGLLNQTQIPLECLFNPIIGHPVFGATMHAERFQFLQRHVCCDSNADSQTKDFACMKNFYELFNENCASSVIPGHHIALSQTLYPSSKIYKDNFLGIKSEQIEKRGLIFKSLTAGKYPYTHVTRMTADQSLQPTECQNHDDGAEALVKELVMELRKFTETSGRNFIFDSSCTSMLMANWLLDHDATFIGRLHPDDPMIPHEIRTPQYRKIFTYKCRYEASKGNHVLNSYVPKYTKQGRVNLLLLDTIQPVTNLSKSENCKSKHQPVVYDIYYSSKGHCDVIDERTDFFTCHFSSKSWKVAALNQVLDVCRVNASTILALNLKREPSLEYAANFGLKLALDLVCPHIETRKKASLPLDVHHKMVVILGKQPADLRFPGQAVRDSQTNYPRFGTRGRCVYCRLNNLNAGKSQKSSIARLKKQCQVCGKYICPKHSIQHCISCMCK